MLLILKKIIIFFRKFIIKYMIFILFLFYCGNINALNKDISIASTTSTHDTGLLKYLNKFFTNKFNINVKVLSLGTGQAIRIAEDGNVEILLVHHLPSELEFMNNDYGLLRYDLMYNDFVLIGPKEDNKKCKSIKKKLHEIEDNKLQFISRGDDSGTHKKELELWKLINKVPDTKSFWYLSIGQSMGQTLLISNNKKAYTLSDRSTWLTFKKKDNLKIVCQNLPPLFNQYGIILVNNKINKKLNIKDAQKYINWIISDEAKMLINNYKVNGEQLFFFNNN